jgi:hypothetical protein
MPQNYQYTEYTFLGVTFSAIVLPDTQIVTTTAALAVALDTPAKVLRGNYQKNAHMFNPLRASLSGPKEIRELLRRHGESFGVQRIREDLLLWTEEDIYMHCHLSRSERAAQFMQHNVRFLREWRVANIPLNAIPPERFAQLEATCGELQARLDKIERLPPIDGTASIKFSVN